MDEFLESKFKKGAVDLLDEVYKKSISDKIRKHNKEKQLLRESSENQVQDLSSVTSRLSHNVETVASDNQLTSGESKLSHKRKISKNIIVQDVFDLLWMNQKKSRNEIFDRLESPNP